MSIRFPNSYTPKYYFWTAFKATVTAKSLSMQYDDDVDDNGTTMYTIYAYDSPKVNVCTIYKVTVPPGIIPNYSQSQNDSDKSDFETNYKTGANQSVSGAASDNSANSGFKTPVLPARANTSNPTWTDGYMAPLSVDTSGALRITGSISASNPSVSTTGTAVPASATMVGGSDGTNLRAIKTASDGTIRIDPIGTTTQPVSGTVTANAGTGNFNVIGTGTDNTANSTTKLPVLAARANTSAPTFTDGNMVPLSVDTTGALRITGSISASNPSVSTTGSAPPASATYLGGSVTTAAPSYTNGQMSGLSLDTAGALRTTNSAIGTIGGSIGTTVMMVGGKDSFSDYTAFRTLSDGSLFVTQTTASSLRSQTSSESNTGASPPAQASLMGGSVTTAAPSYTNGQMSALSLDTTGALRITGSISATNPSVVTASSALAGYVTLGGAYASSSPITLLDGYIGYLSQNSSGGGLRVEGSKRNADAWDGLCGSMVIGARATDTPLTLSNDTVATLTVNTLGGGLRVEGSKRTTDTFNSAHGLMSAGARVNTSAQTYSNDSWAPLSMDTGGALRVNSSPSDTTASGTLNGLNAAATISLTGQPGAGFQLAAGTLIGTIVPEISFDGGTTWVATQFDDPITGNKATSIVFGSSNTATARTIVVAGGASNARVRVSAFTSGTASCGIRASQASDPTVLFSGAPAGSLPPTLIYNGASVTTAAPSYTNGTINGLSLTTAGSLRVDGTISQGGNTAVVKAASTAAAAADPALVVAISPNNSIVVTQGSTTSGQSGHLTQGAVTTAPPAYTTAQTSPLSLSTAGGLRVELQTTAKTSYSGAARNVTPPATPTDMVTITGSASKTIRVLKMIISSTQTTAGVNEFFVVKRSTANSAGTSTGVTALPFDSTNAAVTATVLQYSANPTLGNTVANVQVVKLLTPQSTSATQPQYVMDFTNGGLSQGIVLRGTGQVLAFNFGGAALPTGLNVACTFEWTEE